MAIPPYFLPRPGPDPDATTIAAFERLFASAVAPGTGAAIAYTLTAPKWQFLCYLCDTKGVLAHGSGQADIAEFEPRQSSDVAEFGARRAVYAASDGLWGKRQVSVHGKQSGRQVGYPSPEARGER